MSKYYRSVLNVLTPAFSSTKSMAFDGVDDYINMGNPTDLQITGALSISAWVKFTGDSGPVVTKARTSGGVRSYGLWGDRSGSSHRPEFFIYNSGTAYSTPDTGARVDDGNWHHLLAVFNPSTYLRLYIDGNLEQENTTSIPATIDNDSVDFYIGSSELSSFFFTGNIDEVAVWNSDQSSNISAIYNSGVPADLSSYSPTAWYRMGENGSWKSTQWLLPKNSNKDKVSNYSFEFDGVDDKISLGSSIDLGLNSTISLWVKRGSTSGQVFLGETSYNSNYLLYVTTTLFFRIGNNAKNFAGATVEGIMNDTTNWINIIFVRSGDSVELFLNGSSMGSKTGLGTTVTTKIDTIGDRPTGSFPSTGNFDEIAFWDSALTDISSIYNSGTPADLTSLSPVSWYRMGENATFSTNWTVPDQVGSNDGTSANMTIEDRVGEAPNSSNNSLSYNMDEADRETHVPS